MKRKRRRTHSDGLKIDISGRDLRLNERGEGKKKLEDTYFEGSTKDAEFDERHGYAKSSAFGVELEVEGIGASKWST